MGATPYKLDIELKFTIGNKDYGVAFTLEEDGPIELEIDVPDSTTDQEVPLAIDVSQVKAILFLATVDMTVETNDGSSPSNTLSLTANRPYIWYANALDTFQLTVDVTKLYVSNSSGAAGVLSIAGLQDATPS